MPTVLFTYEFGAGLGHLNRLIAVARSLGPGHRLVFALPEPSRHEAILRRALGDTVEIRQGARWPPPTDPAAWQVLTLTFADTIRLFGFHIVDRLLEAAHGSARLLREVSPQLIVADFAPTLRLASGGRLPTVVVGNGYTVLPPGRPLPPLRPWTQAMHPQSRAHEAALLAAANEVSARLSGPAIDFFADLFNGEESFVCTIPEFDPYRNSRTTPPLWPFNIPRMPPARAFAERRGAPVFGYFHRAHPALRRVLGALSGLEVRTEIYIEGAAAEQIAQYCSPRVGVHRTPADFGTVLPGAQLIVHHAGLGTAYAALAAGVPQLVLPLNLEHEITAKGLEPFGASVAIEAKPPPEIARLQQAMQQALEDTGRQHSALQAAGEIERRRDDASLDRIVAACAARL